MVPQQLPLECLLTLPGKAAQDFFLRQQAWKRNWSVTSDPPGKKLGTGGATTHALVEAWRADKRGQTFSEWLRGSRRLIIHGGGDCADLPAYATMGKPLIPVPVFRWARGQRLDQTLMDLLASECERIWNKAANGYLTMVASGDTIVRLPKELPPLPSVDVLGLGFWEVPEVAKDFGVFFSSRKDPQALAFFEQKPTASRMRSLMTDYLCLADTGIWLLSERAASALMLRCGWKAKAGDYDRSGIRRYELYRDFGPALGTKPALQDELLNSLTCAVVPLNDADLFHFGSSRQMIESVSRLQNIELDESKLGLMGAKRHPDQYLQNAQFEFPLRLEQNHTLWVENSVIPRSWELAHSHVLTGVPDNQWDLRLEPGVCLDFVPVGQAELCLRIYGINDAFRETVGASDAHWLGQSPGQWFSARGLTPEQAGVLPDMPLVDAPLFPVMQQRDLSARFMEWIFAANPPISAEFMALWLKARRLSARELQQQANLDRANAQRQRLRTHCLLPMLRNYRWSVFFKLDLEATASLYTSSKLPLPELSLDSADGLEPLQAVHDQMFRSAVMRQNRKKGWQKYEENAFTRLREMIVRDAQLSPVLPRPCIMEDQIVWGRSPVRLDLAGGWTDTPPYCLEYGGKVVNLAVDLNGQPPIQVFGKLSKEPELVIRSIDLGIEQRVRTYEELDTYALPGSGFALAKAAMALAGFLPRFHAANGAKTLKKQLLDFGGGIEISMLSAVPKGSGLGTSSVMAATLLATLGDLCGLNWDKNVLFTRTLALEQMLTTGGGWQDQAGAIFRAIKCIETSPGLNQKPTLRWLPSHLFGPEYANKTILLYYTGVTRLAKNILHEIVRGMFLNSPRHLRIVADIGANAEVAYNALQKCDYQDLGEAIQNSWTLNQRLDPGTNPPQIQKILTPITDYLLATKLLGAGGGGYLLMLAKDETAAARIQKTLEDNPPNPTARFVKFNLSEESLQLTRS